MPVIDASVYVALAQSRDRHHSRALAWFEESVALDDRRVAPNLLLVEAAASIRRLTGDDRLLAFAVGEKLRSDGLIQLLPLTIERGEAAMRLAAEIGVRGADAVYLALAVELDQPLVTLDAQQRRRGAEVAEIVTP